MSTLNVSNITDGTTTVGTSYVLNGSAKAWVNFNGTGTVATRDSFNVASLTDNAAGDYSINFSSNMDSADYSPSSIARGNDQVIGVSTPTASSARYNAVDLDGNRGLSDTDTVSIHILGDLA